MQKRREMDTLGWPAHELVGAQRLSDTQVLITFSNRQGEEVSLRLDETLLQRLSGLADMMERPRSETAEPRAQLDVDGLSDGGVRLTISGTAHAAVELEREDVASLVAALSKALAEP